MTPVIAIFDVGKTNKKLFLFDEHYNIVYEKSARFLETMDDDGFPCENIEQLRQSVFDSLNEILHLRKYSVKTINFTTYGASIVYVDKNGNPVAPLYNYLKPYPDNLLKQFYDKHGETENIALQTASPCLGSLNAGLQLYRVKNQQPELYQKIHKALHLPQYLSSLLTGQFYSDITSIGCHTQLWNYAENDYHEWVYREGINRMLPPLFPAEEIIEANYQGEKYYSGVGLHDSSAALIPYLINFKEPFILISTGTWSISMNPFNTQPLTKEELAQDCLCYLNYKGFPVKAARLFAGYFHEQEVKRIAAHFEIAPAIIRNIEYDPQLLQKLSDSRSFTEFDKTALNIYETAAEAYHALIMDIIRRQTSSTNLIIQPGITKKIFVDGGFSKNVIYMNLLSAAFPDMEIFAASMAQATALGAALAIHQHWNAYPLPNDIIELKYYSSNI